MDFMELFDVIIVAFGIYVVFSSLRMKKTGEISSIVVNKVDIPKCKDPSGFIAFMYPKTILFGVIATLFGFFGMFNDVFYSLGIIANWVSIGIFLGIWIWFTFSLKKGREKFF